jgi:hypothetical protein
MCHLEIKQIKVEGQENTLVNCSRSRQRVVDFSHLLLALAHRLFQLRLVQTGQC